MLSAFSCLDFLKGSLIPLVVTAQLVTPTPLSLPMHVVGPYTVVESQRYQKEVQKALRLVAQFPPPSLASTVLNRQKTLEAFDDKHVKIIITNSTDSHFQNLFAQTGGVPSDADALTLTVENQDKTKSILLFLFTDRLSKESSLPVALIVSLAHELYGNAQKAIEDPTGQVRTSRTVDHIRQEIRAFRTSVEFLENFIKQSAFTKFDIAMQNDLHKALERERRALQIWEAQAP